MRCNRCGHRKATGRKRREVFSGKSVICTCIEWRWFENKHRALNLIIFSRHHQAIKMQKSWFCWLTKLERYIRALAFVRKDEHREQRSSTNYIWDYKKMNKWMDEQTSNGTDKPIDENCCFHPVAEKLLKRTCCSSCKSILRGYLFSFSLKSSTPLNMLYGNRPNWPSCCCCYYFMHTILTLLLCCAFIIIFKFLCVIFILSNNLNFLNWTLCQDVNC